MATLCCEWCSVTCAECKHSITEHNIAAAEYTLAGCEIHPDSPVSDDWGCDDFFCFAADWGDGKTEETYTELEKEKTRANRRKNDFKKAKHKQYISQHVFGFDWYDELHKYSKGKIHCSCPLCSQKVKLKIYGDNWPISDRKKLDNLKIQQEELEEGGNLGWETEKLNN